MKEEQWISTHLEKMYSGEMNYSNWDRFIDEKLQKCDYKLYKYYSFEDKYAVSNLKEGLIHFSNPENFNDPFDCYMGFSVNEIMKSMFDPLFCENFQFDGPYKKQTQKAIKSIIFGGEFEKDTSPEIHIISLLINSEPMLGVLKRECDGEKVSKEELNAAIQSAIATENFQKGIVEILKIGFSMDNIKSLFDEKRIAELLDIICGNPQILKSLIPESEDKSKLMPLFSTEEDFLEKLKIIAKNTGQNTAEIDEKIIKFKETMEIIVDELREKINSAFTVTCFSKNPDNILMWSHYSNKHKGFCVEYDLKKMKSVDARLMLFPVLYSNKRPIIPTSLIDFSDLNNVKINTDSKAMIDMVLTLLTKSDAWGYEEEWRIIYPKEKFKKEDNQCITEQIASKVYLGANISSENEKLIRTTIEDKIPIEKLYISHEMFKLIRKS